MGVVKECRSQIQILDSIEGSLSDTVDTMAGIRTLPVDMAGILTRFSSTPP